MQDAVARVYEDFAQQVEGLLRTGSNEDIVSRDLEAVAGGMAGEHLTKGAVALGGAILQRLAALFVEDALGGFGDLFDGEQIGRGQTAREGNDVALFG